MSDFLRDNAYSAHDVTEKIREHIEKLNEINADLAAKGNQIGNLSKNRSAFVNVAEYGAKTDGTADVSVIVQDLLDDGYKKLMFPEGTYRFDTTILIHDKAGLVIEGAGADNTIFTAGANLQFNTSRLPAIGLDGNYNKQTFFIITMYDGETDRLNRAARNMNFRGFTFDGSSYYRQIHGISGQGIAFCKFDNILAKKMKSVGDIDAGNADYGKSYHLDFNDIRSIDCEYHIKPTVPAGVTAEIGTTWRFTNNAIDKNKYGYQLTQLNYSTMIDCSVDNLEMGSYAYDINKCKGLEIINPAVEARYKKEGIAGFENCGSGFFKVADSVVSMRGGFWVGGDRAGLGTGNISDYGITKSLMLISGNSRIEITNPVFDCQVGTSTSVRYPLYVENNASVIFHTGENTFQSGDVQAYDTAITHIIDRDGNITAKKGASRTATVKLIGFDNALDTINTTTYVGQVSANLNTAISTMDYQINFGGLGISDYTTVGLPTTTNPWGILFVKRAGNYISQRLHLTNNDFYIRTSSNAGSTWSAWTKATTS